MNVQSVLERIRRAVDITDNRPDCERVAAVREVLAALDAPNVVDITGRQRPSTDADFLRGFAAGRALEAARCQRRDALLRRTVEVLDDPVGLQQLVAEIQYVP